MRSRGPHARWRPRQFTLLLAAAVIALLGTAAYTYAAYRNAAIQVVMERERQVIYLSAARLQGEFSKFSDSLTALARIPGLLAEDPRPREAALAQADYRLADFDGGVVLLDHFGRVIASQPSHPAILGQDWSDREVFRSLLGTPRVAFSNARSEGLQDDQVIAVGAPVLGEGGQFSGAVVGMFQLGKPTISAFYASIVRLRLETAENTYVVDGEGTILYDKSLTLVGLGFADEVIRDLDLHAEAASVRLHDRHGRDVVASFAPIPGTPWTLVSLTDWQSLTSSTRPYANLLLGALAVGMLAPATGVMLLVRQRDRERQERERGHLDGRVLGSVQQAFRPRSLPAVYGWEIEARRPAGRPAPHLLDDHLLLEDGRLMVSLLRASENGLAGAAALISARAALRAAAQAGHEPAEAMRGANRLLSLDRPERPVHALFGYLDPERGEFSFALAGMDPPLLPPPHDGRVPSAGGGGLGQRPDQTPITGHLRVDHGGLLILSSGLLGGHGPHGEDFGLERVLECLARVPDEADSQVEGIMAELERSGWSTDEEVFVLALHRSPARELHPVEGP